MTSIIFFSNSRSLEQPGLIIETTLFRNESITDINYPELLTAFYHYIIYMHIKNAYKN